MTTCNTWNREVSSCFQGTIGSWEYNQTPDGLSCWKVKYTGNPMPTTWNRRIPGTTRRTLSFCKNENEMTLSICETHQCPMQASVLSIDHWTQPADASKRCGKPYTCRYTDICVYAHGGYAKNHGSMHTSETQRFTLMILHTLNVIAWAV